MKARFSLAIAGVTWIATNLGCGGKVVLEGSGGAGGSGVTSAATGSAECVLGVCGDACTKCTGSTCVNGKCDQKGTCQPPDVTFTCGK